MAKITSVNIGDTGTVAKNKINEALETVATDASLTGDGNVGTELSVDDTQISITASQVSDFDTEVSNNASVTANTAKVSWGKNEEIAVACSDLTTDLAVGTTKGYIRMPFAMTLTEVRASVLTAPTGSTLTVDINEGGVSILSTKITIDISEKTSTTAATPPVISDSSLADDSEVTIDIDQVGSTVTGAGLVVYLIGTRT